MEKLIITTAIILGVCAIYAFVLPYVKKKNINFEAVTKNAEEGLEEAKTIIKSAEVFAPDNKVLNILDIIDNLALRSTKAMQQLAISGQLPLDKRRETAKENIVLGLKAFGIPVDENLGKVIDDAVQAFVYDGKSEAEKKGQEQNIMQKQNETLQQQIGNLVEANNKFSQENQMLKQKISNIAAQTV